MRRALFQRKTCKQCGKMFEPQYANQRVHKKCQESWRQKYMKAYQRDYQRKLRQMGEGELP